MERDEVRRRVAEKVARGDYFFPEDLVRAICKALDIELSGVIDNNREVVHRGVAVKRSTRETIKHLGHTTTRHGDTKTDTKTDTEADISTGQETVQEPENPAKKGLMERVFGDKTGDNAQPEGGQHG